MRASEARDLQLQYAGDFENGVFFTALQAIEDSARRGRGSTHVNGGSVLRSRLMALGYTTSRTDTPGELCVSWGPE